MAHGQSTQGPKQPSLPPPGTALKAHEYAEKRDWPRYFQAVAGKGPRDTLLKALDLFDKEPDHRPRSAVDLGCGSGRDTLELLRRGWGVVATDGHPLAIELLLKDAPAAHKTRLTCEIADFETIRIPPSLLVNASYSLPFCEPAVFSDLWNGIVGAIPPGGRFAGQFFGERDDWARLPDRTHHTRSQVDRLLTGFLIESLTEAENREAGATGEIKNWHIFHVVARKRA